nr:hypothetical protein [Tanacetum cinerariifolium]
MIADADSLSQIPADLWMACGSNMWSIRVRFVVFGPCQVYDTLILGGFVKRLNNSIIFGICHTSSDTLGMERGFLSQNGSRVGRGVKEKQGSMVDKSVEVGVTSAIQEGVTPSVVDMTVDMGKQNSIRYYCPGIHSTIIYAGYYYDW